MNANGSEQHAITSGPEREYGPVWSPDGIEMAFLDFGSRTVYLMNADGSARRPVHPGGVQFEPAWQPHPEERDD